MWELLKLNIETLKGTTSPNANTEALCQRLIDVCSRKEEIADRLTGPSEIEFNWNVATEIMQPLSGGVCIINKKPCGLSRDNDHSKNVVIPKEIEKDGLIIGRKILLLSSNKLGVATG